MQYALLVYPSIYSNVPGKPRTGEECTPPHLHSVLQRFSGPECCEQLPHIPAIRWLCVKLPQHCSCALITMCLISSTHFH